MPVSDPTVDADVIFVPLASDADNRVKANVAALYIQDQIRPAQWLEIVAGLRFDSFKVDVNDLRAVGGGRFGRRDHLWSPRLGLVLKPTEDLSIYANYSRSYLPQSGDQFSGLTSITEGLKPERFDNYEVGAKLQLPGRPAGDSRRLSAGSDQYAGDRPNEPGQHGADRRPAQPRH